MAPDLPVDSPEFRRAWARFRVVAAVVCVVVFGVAAWLSHRWTGAHPDVRADASPATPTLLRPASLPDDHLAALGATPAKFRAAHQPDRGRGEFGAMVADPASGDARPTWDTAASISIDVVDDIFHAFAPGTSADVALKTVLAQDLPPDARRVSSTVPTRACRVDTYRSATIAAAAPEADVGDGTVQLRLTSRVGARYSAADVQDVEEILNPDDQPSC